jgi:hypothetical protein
MQQAITNIALAAELTTEVRYKRDFESVRRLIDTFLRTDGEARVDFAITASTLGGHIIVAQYLIQPRFHEFQTVFLLFINDCLTYGESTSARLIAWDQLLEFLWRLLQTTENQTEWQVLPRIIAAVLPCSQKWMKNLMSHECIQIVGSIPPSVPVARIFLVLISDEDNLRHKKETELIVNQCLRFLRGRASENMDVSLQILTSLGRRKKFTPDRFSLEIVLPAVHDAIRKPSGERVGALHYACIDFLGTLSEVPAEVVAAVAEFCLPSSDSEVSIKALDFVKARVQMFSKEDLAQLQVFVSEGIVKRLDGMRLKDAQFLMELLENQEIVDFDIDTIEILLAMVERKMAGEREAKFLTRAIQQYLEEGEDAILELQPKLNEYESPLDDFIHKDLVKFSALHEAVVQASQWSGE